eukprot:7514314-Alexandrium_andersonii.AAC.1
MACALLWYGSPSRPSFLAFAGLSPSWFRSRAFLHFLPAAWWISSALALRLAAVLAPFAAAVQLLTGTCHPHHSRWV